MAGNGRWTSSPSGAGSHEVQWIRPGLPAAGNFLIFNNGQYLFERTNQSSILEINGFLDADKQHAGRM